MTQLPLFASTPCYDCTSWAPKFTPIGPHGAIFGINGDCRLTGRETRYEDSCAKQTMVSPEAAEWHRGRVTA
jgi:hypothetical protein